MCVSTHMHVYFEWVPTHSKCVCTWIKEGKIVMRLHAAIVQQVAVRFMYCQEINYNHEAQGAFQNNRVKYWCS